MRNTQLSRKCGSSPQVRGKLLDSLRQVIHARLIPAGAGKTLPLSLAQPHTSAHPRRCGENKHELRVFNRRHGSSPQVRGKLSFPFECSMRRRLIPAGAGKTSFRCVALPGYTAHPRRCGENVTLRVTHRALPGSSPQVRGKLRLPVLDTRRGRLIPAGAGKTARLRLGAGFSSAHPRRCGENYAICSASNSMMRLIPAGAGKT